MLKKIATGLLPLLGLALAGHILANALPTSRVGNAQSFQEDTSKTIHVINAKSLEGEKLADGTDITRFKDNVIFRQGTTYLYCDSAVLNKVSNIVDAYGHVHINQADSVHTYADLLHYDGNPRIATLIGNAKLTDGKTTIVGPELSYDLNAKIGTYLKGGKLTNTKTVLTSGVGYYYATTKDVFFKNDVLLVDPEYTLSTDTLLYNTDTKIATIIAPTTIYDGKTTMYTTSGYYNTELGYGDFGSRPIIEDSTSRFTANAIQMDKKTGMAYATGNLVWRDTAQKISVLGNYGVVNQNEKSLMATQKPVLLLEGKDTIFIAGDTLFSGIEKPVKDMIKKNIDSTKKVNAAAAAKKQNPRSQAITPLKPVSQDDPMGGNDPVARLDSASIPADSAFAHMKKDTVKTPADTTEYRYMKAFHHVKIFSDSLQGVADSVYYTSRDSVFRLYGNPLLWSREYEMFGDTVKLFTKNQKASRVLLDQNAMVISKVSKDLYNQVKGRVIWAYISNDKLDSIHVEGNAETVYYVQDEDSSFIGITHLKCARVMVYFENGEVDRAVYIKEPDGIMDPMGQKTREIMFLPGFHWDPEKRPKTKYELIGN
ncbi:lipopolysaccharide transport protein LptA [Chitinophaga skermanii]|uniref:Lipopolysaccharide transport protein LptA n=1 Tax=Chitinophaga skermanii TaxID=331697 RepID=A0A327Q710_9BACT|nr:OstA-like protein [Chitinophaga skermanii]RAJ00366.1 lipopolysaccharide transport protein LptA [Chitinophaga skermanii]